MGFGYDGLQRLDRIYWNFGANGIVDRFHDGDDMVLEARNTACCSPQFQYVCYVHGPGDDQPLAMEIYPVLAQPVPGTGTVYYFHADGEGSVRLLTDASAQVANRYDYDSFGRRLASVESVPQMYGWKGRDWLAGPDLVFNRARFYDPVMGRFVSEDPLGYGSDDYNFYSFAWNNVKNWRDPTGLSATEEAADESASTGAIVGGGTVAVGPGGVIATPGGAAAISLTTRSGVQRIGARIACYLFAVADAINFGSDPTLAGAMEAAGDLQNCAGHRKKRPSTKPKHEKGDSRRQDDRGGEKADEERRSPRKPPPGWDRGWPPKNKPVQAPARSISPPIQ